MSELDPDVQLDMIEPETTPPNTLLPASPIAGLSSEAEVLRRSLKAEDTPELPGVVRTEDFYRLRFLLSRYVLEGGAPRSVLVEGYRGAGKTTFVRTLLEDVWRASRIGAHDSEPLPIVLDAPTMLTQELPEERTPTDPEQADRLRVLTHVATQLSAAVERRFLAAFLQRSEGRDHAELYARLQLELRGAPTPEMLLEFWSRYEATATGILPSPPASTAEDDTTVLHSRPPGHSDHRGIDEMMLLWSTLGVLQRLTTRGSMSYSSSSAMSENRSREERFAIDPTQLTRALAAGSVLGGLAAGVVGDGVVTGFAALAGAVTGWSSAERRDASVSNKAGFSQDLEVDMSISSLTRLIPELVRRMRRLGLAPVFIVDELDKLDGGNTTEVDDAGQRVHLFHALKAFINDDAFFFFLDHPRRRPHHTVGYSVESTLWQDRALLAYSPNEVLEALMAFVDPPAGLAATGQRASLATLGLVAAFDGDNHLYTALRRIESLIEYRGNERHLQVGEPSSRQRVVGTFQLALMAWFQTPEVRTYIDTRRTRVLWLLDAVHWLTTQWRRAESTPPGFVSEGPHLVFGEGEPTSGAEAYASENPEETGGHDRTRGTLRHHLVARRLGLATVDDLPDNLLNQLNIEDGDEVEGIQLLDRLCRVLSAPEDLPRFLDTHLPHPGPAAVGLDPLDTGILRRSDVGYRFAIRRNGSIIHEGAVRSVEDTEHDEQIREHRRILDGWADLLQQPLGLDFTWLQAVGALPADLQDIHRRLHNADLSSSHIKPNEVEQAIALLERHGESILVHLALASALHVRLEQAPDALVAAMSPPEWPEFAYTRAMATEVFTQLGADTARLALDGASSLATSPERLQEWWAALHTGLAEADPPSNLLRPAFESARMCLLGGVPATGTFAAEWLARALGEPTVVIIPGQVHGAAVSTHLDRLLVHLRGQGAARPRTLGPALDWLGVPAEVHALELPLSGKEDDSDDKTSLQLLSGWSWLNAPPGPSRGQHPAVLTLSDGALRCMPTLPFRSRDASITVVSAIMEQGWAPAVTRWAARLSLTHVVIDAGNKRSVRALRELVRTVQHTVGPTPRMILTVSAPHAESTREGLGDAAVVVEHPKDLPSLFAHLQAAGVL